MAATGCGDDEKPATVDVVVSALDFGATDCGATGIPRVLVISNTSYTPMIYSTALAGGTASPYVVVPPAGVVLPNAQLSVTVYTKAIPEVSEVTPNLYGDTLTVTTDRAGDEPHVVAISQTAHGAILQVSTATVNFPTALPLGGTPGSLPYTITNVGNADAEVSFEHSGPGFSFSPVDTATLAAAGSLAGTVQYAAAATVAEHGKLSMTAVGPSCAPTPSIVATGTGTAAGLAAQPVPAMERGRARNGFGTSTLCVRTTTGVVACTGRNTYGMRGTTDARLALLSGVSLGGGGGGQVPNAQDFAAFNLVETKTGILKDVVELAGGRGFYCARRQQGEVWCWGAYQGGTGNGNQVNTVSNPFATQLTTGVTGLSVGYSNRCVVNTTGDVSCTAGDSGSASNFSRQTWHLNGATAVAVSGGTGYGVLVDKTVMSFGKNRDGERGNDGSDNADAAPVQNLTDVVKVVAGGNSSPNRGRRFGCALKQDQTVWCWGANRHGQLGNGTNSNTNDPVQVEDATAALAGVTAVAAGQSHACAIIGGVVSCWGRGREGQLGSGNLNDVVSKAEPTVPALTNATSLGLGSRTTCAVLATGALSCWGRMGGIVGDAPTPIDAFEPI